MIQSISETLYYFLEIIYFYKSSNAQISPTATAVPKSIIFKPYENLGSNILVEFYTSQQLKQHGNLQIDVMFLEANRKASLKEENLQNSTNHSISQVQAKILKKYKQKNFDPLQTSFDIYCNQDNFNPIQQVSDEYISDAKFLHSHYDMGPGYGTENIFKSHQKSRKSSFDSKYTENEQPQSPIYGKGKGKLRCHIQNKPLQILIHEKNISKNQIRMILQQIKLDFDLYKQKIGNQIKEMSQFICSQGQKLKITLQQKFKKQSIVSAKNQMILKLQKQIQFLKEQNHAKAIKIKEMQMGMRDQQINIERLNKRIEKQGRQTNRQRSTSEKLKSLQPTQQFEHSKQSANIAVSLFTIENYQPRSGLLFGKENPQNKNFSVNSSNSNSLKIKKQKKRYEDFVIDSVYIPCRNRNYCYLNKEGITSAASSEDSDMSEVEIKRNTISIISQNQKTKIFEMNRSDNRSRKQANWGVNQYQQQTNIAQTSININDQKANRVQRNQNMAQLQNKIKKLKQQL